MPSASRKDFTDVSQRFIIVYHRILEIGFAVARILSIIIHFPRIRLLSGYIQMITTPMVGQSIHDRGSNLRNAVSQSWNPGVNGANEFADKLQGSLAINLASTFSGFTFGIRGWKSQATCVCLIKSFGIRRDLIHHLNLRIPTPAWNRKTRREIRGNCMGFKLPDSPTRKQFKFLLSGVFPRCFLPTDVPFAAARAERKRAIPRSRAFYVCATNYGPRSDAKWMNVLLLEFHLPFFSSSRFNNSFLSRTFPPHIPKKKRLLEMGTKKLFGLAVSFRDTWRIDRGLWLPGHTELNIAGGFPVRRPRRIFSVTR